jgi:hypothetical protein
MYIRVLPQGTEQFAKEIKQLRKTDFSSQHFKENMLNLFNTRKDTDFPLSLKSMERALDVFAESNHPDQFIIGWPLPYFFIYSEQACESIMEQYQGNNIPTYHVLVNRRQLLNGKTEVISVNEADIQANETFNNYLTNIGEQLRMVDKNHFFPCSPLKFIQIRFQQLVENKLAYEKLLDMGKIQLNGYLEDENDNRTSIGITNPITNKQPQMPEGDNIDCCRKCVLS